MQAVPVVVLLVPVHLAAVAEDTDIVLRTVDEIHDGLGHFGKLPGDVAEFYGFVLFLLLVVAKNGDDRLKIDTHPEKRSSGQ